MFVQLSAWFADDVTRSVKNMWTDNDGIITVYPHSAYFLFVDNPGSKQAYEQIIDDHSDFIGLACISVDWIRECIKRNEMVPCTQFAIDKEDTVIQYRDIYMGSLQAYEEEQEREREKRRKKSQSNLFTTSSSTRNGCSRYNEEDYKFRKQNVTDIRSCYKHPNSAGLNDLSEFIESFQGNDSGVNKYIDFKIDNGKNNGFKVTRIPKDEDDEDNDSGIYESSRNKNKNNNNNNSDSDSPKSKNKKSSSSSSTTKDNSSNRQTTIKDFAVPISKMNNGNRDTKSGYSGKREDSHYQEIWSLDEKPQLTLKSKETSEFILPPKPSTGYVKPPTKQQKPKPPPTTADFFDETMYDMDKNEDQKVFKKQEYAKNESPFNNDNEVHDEIEDDKDDYGIKSISGQQFDHEIGSKNKSKQPLQFQNTNTNTAPPKLNNGAARKRSPSVAKISPSHQEIVVLDDDD